jgi:hypothetical protein
MYCIAICIVFVYIFHLKVNAETYSVYVLVKIKTIRKVQLRLMEPKRL